MNTSNTNGHTNANNHILVTGASGNIGTTVGGATFRYCAARGRPMRPHALRRATTWMP